MGTLLQNNKDFHKKKLAASSLLMGQRSYLLIGHLQELGVHVSGTLPFLVEEEFVVAAVGTNGCRGKEKYHQVGKTQEQSCSLCNL